MSEIYENESILTSVKAALGILDLYEYFDAQLVMHINTVFSILTQIGVGPSNGFKITGKDERWSDFMEDTSEIEMIKTYVALRVRILFDPPASSFVLESINKQIEMLEWRLNVHEDVVET